MKSIFATASLTMVEMEGKPGAFCFEAEEKGLFYNCPCGCESQGFIPFRGKLKEGEDRPSWEFDGNKDQPTLSPSIRRLSGCKWHGHLKAGVWTFEADSGK